MGAAACRKGVLESFPRLQDSLPHGASETQEPAGNDTSGHYTVWKAYTMSCTGLRQLLEVRRRAVVEERLLCISLLPFPTFPSKPLAPSADRGSANASLRFGDLFF